MTGNKFSAFLFVGAIFSLPTLAEDSVTCKITRADNAPFMNFVGGSVSIDLKNGNNRLYTTDVSGNTLQYISVSNDLVSSFAVERKTCKASVKKERGDGGKLKSVHFVFENCEYKDPSVPNYTAYVSVTESFNLETNRGIYQELFVDGGETKSPNFFFSDCVVF